MLNIITSKEKVKDVGKYVAYNDAFFVKYTQGEKITAQDEKAIMSIDKAKLITSGEGVRDRFETPYGIIGEGQLSTGCKTLLNIMHHKEKVFDCIESGGNVHEWLSKYCCEYSIDVSVVYTESTFKIAKGAVVTVNGRYSVRSTAEFIKLKVTGIGG
jgi:hypothetical protein